jgi:DNA gyrase/topoisomerase IV subunit B
MSHSGMTVVNALSEYFRMTAYREAEKTKHILEFHEGVLVKDEMKQNKTGKHGTIIEFKTSKKYMGDEVELPIDDVKDWVESLFYLNSDNLKSKGISCKLTVYDGMELKDTYKFKPKPFADLINRLIPASLKKKDFTDVCVLKGDTVFIENSKTLVTNDDGTTSVEMEDTEKHIHLDIAFRYCTRTDISSSAEYDTYCNYTNTIDNGTHLEAFDESYCRYIQSKVNDSMSDSQKNKMKVTWDDVRTNLYCVINLSSDAQVGFVGNAKTQISCKELLPYMKEIVTSSLDEYFNTNPSALTEIIKIVKLNVKARMEAAKAKSATQVERLNTFKEHKNSYCAL